MKTQSLDDTRARLGLFTFLWGLSDRFECVDGIQMPSCQTGDLYVEISIEGTTWVEATKGWIAEVEEYAKDKVGTLYWGLQPDPYAAQTSGTILIVGRLVITDNPSTICPCCYVDFESPRALAAHADVMCEAVHKDSRDVHLNLLTNILGLE